MLELQTEQTTKVPSPGEMAVDQFCQGICQEISNAIGEALRVARVNGGDLDIDACVVGHATYVVRDLLNLVEEIGPGTLAAGLYGWLSAMNMPTRRDAAAV